MLLAVRPFRVANLTQSTTRMSENVQPTAKKTLGLTGLTVNAMALIAPGAFLWLTFAQQCLYGQPMAGIAMWFGILVALLLCFATAISYAELSKLYPGAGSSYFFAEQAFLSKSKVFQICPNCQIRGRMGQPSLLLDLPGCDGRRHRAPGRISCRTAVPVHL